MFSSCICINSHEEACLLFMFENVHRVKSKLVTDDVMASIHKVKGDTEKAAWFQQNSDRKK